MSERIRGSYDDALYKSTYTLLYCTLSQSDKLKILISYYDCWSRETVSSVCNSDVQVMHNFTRNQRMFCNECFATSE